MSFIDLELPHFLNYKKRNLEITYEKNYFTKVVPVGVFYINLK